MASCRTFSVALALTVVACTPTGPLDEDERALLQGDLYFVQGGDEHGQVSTTAMRISAAGGEPEALTDGRTAAFVYGVNPAGDTLALTVADDIFLARADGRSMTRVASSSELDWYPRFSPDGRYIVFESARASFRDLYRLEVATGAVVRLTDNPEGNFDAAWSPDGRKLAFASSRAGQLDLWVMDADGANPVRLTRHPGDSVKPSWSASGRFIAFISARDGKDDLFVVRPDGSEVRKLTPDAPDGKRRSQAEHVQRFAWHPTQDRIAYSARAPRGPTHIYVVDAVTGTADVLSRPKHDDREPTWSPDGEHLAFASVRGQASDIYIMRADGTRRTRVTDEGHRAWLPRWFRGSKRE